MSGVSWVRKVRHAQDLAWWAHPVAEQISHPRWDEVVDRASDEWQTWRATCPVPTGKRHQAYFGSKITSAPLLGIHSRPGKWLIEIEPMAMTEFAELEAERMGVPPPQRALSVTLVAHGVREARVVTATREGRLRGAQLPSLFTGWRMQAEWAWREAERIAWVVELRDFGSEDFCAYLLLDCERLTARDHVLAWVRRDRGEEAVRRYRAKFGIGG